MKDSGTMNGGNFLDKYSDTYANYLLKCLEGFKSHGITAYAVRAPPHFLRIPFISPVILQIGIQNEPENSNPSYPTAKISAAQGAKIATTLRGLMDKNGFQGTKLVGYEHNWKDAAGYPVQTVKAAPSAYAGVAFHCYSGSADQQDAFHTADPSKEIYMTECTGTFGSDFGSDLQVGVSRRAWERCGADRDAGSGIWTTCTSALLSTTRCPCSCGTLPWTRRATRRLPAQLLAAVRTPAVQLVCIHHLPICVGFSNIDYSAQLRSMAPVTP